MTVLVSCGAKHKTQQYQEAQQLMMEPQIPPIWLLKIISPLALVFYVTHLQQAALRIGFCLHKTSSIAFMLIVRPSAALLMRSTGALPRTVRAARGTRSSPVASSFRAAIASSIGVDVFGLLPLNPFISFLLIFRVPARSRSIFFGWLMMALYTELPVYRDTYALILKEFD